MENNILDYCWLCVLRNSRYRNLVYSVSVELFLFISQTNHKALICYFVEHFGDKIVKDKSGQLFSSYFYKYQNFLRSKQVEVSNPEDCCSSAEDSNYIAWKNTLDGPLEDSEDDSTDMFRDDDQSFEKYNHPTPPTDDNPEELLNLLRNHLADPNEPIILDHDDLGKRPFDACNNCLEDP
jgi:hypothetical protein